MNSKTLKLFFTLLVCTLLHSSDTQAQSQAEMSNQAGADFQKSDQELNRVYRQVLSKLDSQSQAEFKAAQRAWVAFRDAEADAEANAQARGGTMAPMLAAMTRTELTDERIRHFKELLKTLTGR